MAREIVITSVPRGVKLGRTGFQVAMQTAGMRDDLAALLEKMAGYRHLPAGAGSNPICYFHRLARTVAGQVCVVGRIVDAGVDFSNRSNKLAHMVVLEAADLGHVASSSPAATLLAIEGRLVTTWTGGPEERQVPFSLAGMPPSHPARCGLWQQVMGDAGWAGVIAERALRNQPTLLVGADPSPASCRRMLTLFQEALSIVPPAKRWGVTFDTTTLVADGILWRGTYAGSPESQATQPGMLVLDLSRPQPIPANMAAGDLVTFARTGAGPAGRVPPTPVGGRGAGSVAAADLPASGPAPALSAARGGGNVPPPPPIDDSEWVDVELNGGRSARRGGLVAIGIAVAVLALVGAGVAGYFTWTIVVRTAAQQKIRGFAESDQGEQPTSRDIQTTLGSQAEVSKDDLSFLNDVLLSPAVKGDHVKDADSIQRMVDAVHSVRTEQASKSKASWGLVLGGEPDANAADLLAWIHEEGFATHGEFRDLYKQCTDLVQLAKGPAEKRNGTAVGPELWGCLQRLAKGPPNAELTFDNKARDAFASAVSVKELASLVELKAAVVRSASPKASSEPKSSSGKSAPPASNAAAGGTGEKSAKEDTPPENLADEFQKFLGEVKTFRDGGKGRWPSKAGDSTLIASVGPGLASSLEVVVGTTATFAAKVERDKDAPVWKIKVGDDVVASIELSAGKVVVKRGEESAWNTHKSMVRFMPIGFKLKGGEPVPNDSWVVLAKPDTVELKGKDTLYDLFCNDKTDAVPLPQGLDRVAVNQVSWQQHRVAIGDTPFTLTVRSDGKVFWIEYIAAIEGREYRLFEPCDMGANGGNVTRRSGVWTNRQSRFALLGTCNNNDNEKTRLGFGSKKQIPAPENNLPNFVVAILKDGVTGKMTVDVAKRLLGAWSPGTLGGAQGAPRDFKSDSFKTLAETRQVLERYITTDGREYRRSRLEEYKKVKPAPPDGDPGDFAVPAPAKKSPDEKDEEYQNRPDVIDWRKLKQKHEERKRNWEAWYEGASSQVNEDARNLDILRLSSDAPLRPKGAKDEVDPEWAAIYMLVELDGMVLAKIYRDELAAAVKRVPVAALFKGDEIMEWKIGSDGTVKIPVAKIVPAGILPPLSSGTPPQAAPSAPAQNAR